MKLYRYLTEDDTAAFCHKVTAALNKAGTCMATPLTPSMRPGASCAAVRRW